MTSTTDTAEHPEVTEISDLSEGLLPPSRTSDVRQHLDACPLCADVYASLEEIRGLLGTLPGPPCMPDDVAGRIDAALAAEALLNATASESHNFGEYVVLSCAATSESGAHVSRETSPGVDRPAGRPRASTSPGRTSKTQRGRRRTAVIAVFAIAALGFGAVLVQSMGENDDTPSAAAPSPDTFSGVELEKRVEDLLSDTETHSTSGRDPFGSSESPDKRTNTFLRTEVPDCIARGIGDATGAIASEPGTYQGADAYLVVLPDRSDDSHVTAYVVGASCLAKGSDSVGEILAKHSYARP